MAERPRRRKKIDAPFPGLRPFLSGENLIFFGREGQSNELIDRLRENHFLAVLGSSGSGKSSLVRAGLQPDLEAGLMAGGRPNWKIAIMRPGDRPLKNLAEALSELIEDPDDEDYKIIPPSTMLMTMLQASSFGLKEAALGPLLGPDDNLVVIVDQFEEIFRFNEEHHDPHRLDEAKAFVRLLMEASVDPNLPIYVVITMRSDFLGECPRFTGLAEAINKGQYLVPRLSRAQMREAITGPVAVFNATIAPDLVIRILNDIGDNADQLPILQHALMRTWDQHCVGEEIVMSDYEAIGGLGNALNQHAEEIFLELDRKGLGLVTEQLFKSLTQLEGDGKGIRRPTRLGEVLAVTGATEIQIKTVVEAFRSTGRTFLMPPHEVPLTPDTMLDISHESFMRLWRRLGGWVREETQSAEEYMRLSRAAVEYKQGKVNLWRQPELGIALKWQEAAHPTKAWAARYDDNFDEAIVFLTQSHAAWEKEEADKAAVVLLQRKSEERRHTVRRLVVLLTLLGSMLTIAIVALLVAWHQNVEATKQRELAESQTKIADSTAKELAIVNSAMEDSTARIVMLNANLKKVNDSLKLYAATIEDQQRELRMQYGIVSDRNRTLEESKKRLAQQNTALDAANAELEIKSNTAAELKEVAERERAIAVAKSALLEALQWAERSVEDPDKETASLLARKAHFVFDSLKSDVNDPRIYWALHSALERHMSMVRHNFYVSPMAMDYDPETDYARVLSLSGGLYELIPEAGRQYLNSKPLAGTNDIRFIAHRDQRKSFILADLEDNLRIFKSSTCQQEYKLVGHQSPITGAVELPGKQQIISCDLGGRVILWDMKFEEPKPFSFVDDPLASFTAIQADAKGNLLALGKKDAIQICQTSTFSTRYEIKVDGAVTALAFSPDGKWLIYGMDNGKVGYCDLKTGMNMFAYQIHKSRVSGIGFSPNGRCVVSSSYDQTLRLWHTGNLAQPPVMLKGHRDWVIGFGFSPDSKKIYSISKDKTMRYWFTDSDDLLAQLENCPTRTEFNRSEVEQYNLPDKFVRGVKK